MTGFYSEMEAAWRAAGNRSRIVIDTPIKLGDRVRVSSAQSGHCTYGLWKRGYAPEIHVHETPEILEIRDHGFVGTVTEIEYVGTFKGYVQRGNSEPWPTFAPHTSIIFRCDIDGAERGSDLAGVKVLR